MSEISNKLLDLFRVGMTRAEFKEKYTQLKETEGGNLSYIFGFNSDITAEDVFDAVNKYNSNTQDINNETNKDDTFDEMDIRLLAEKFQDAEIGRDEKINSDGETATLSETDIATVLHSIYVKKHPEEINQMNIASIQKGLGLNDEELSEEQKQFINSYCTETNLKSLQYQIDEIDTLIMNRKDKAKNRIAMFEARIDNEVMKSQAINNSQKDEYSKNISIKNKKEEELRAKEEQIKNLESEMQEKLTVLALILKDPNHTENDVSSIQSDIQQYKEQIGQYKNSAQKIKESIDGIDNSLNSIRDIVANNSNSKIKDWQKQIKQEQTACEIQIKEYQTLKEDLIKVQENAITQIMSQPVAQEEAQGTESIGATGVSGTSSVSESSSSTSNTTATKDVQKLRSAWNGKYNVNHPPEFYQKVINISKEIGCDANDLLALMASESGLRSNIQNSIGATGLIQFMPSTAKAMNIPGGTAGLKSMSAVEQLDWVKKFFVQNKKQYGFNGKKLTAGDLYALTFLPARAKNEVLTQKGEKYYRANAGLDTNKDGMISKSDLTNRLRKLIPSSAIG